MALRAEDLLSAQFEAFRKVIEVPDSFPIHGMLYLLAHRQLNAHPLGFQFFNAFPVLRRLFGKPTHVRQPVNRKPYPSDLTDDQWQLVQPFLAAAKPGGRPRKTDIREVVNAIFYLNREGCTWRALPHDFPPWQTDTTARGTKSTAGCPCGGGPPTFTHYRQHRQPDRQTRRSRRQPRLRRRKCRPRRHIVVDSLGLLLAVLVTTAAVADAVAASRCWSR